MIAALLLGCLAWFWWCVVGAVVLVEVDHDGRLLEWYKAGPGAGQILVLTAWPYLVRKRRQMDRELRAMGER